MAGGAAWASRSAPHDFDAATQLVELGGGRWNATIRETWDMGGVPNGGYLLAIIGSAMTATAGAPDVVGLTGQFVSPARAGLADIEVRTLRSSERHVHVSAALGQENNGGHVEALGVLGDLAANDGRTRWWGGSPPRLPDPDSCVRLEPAGAADQLPPPHTGHVELRLPEQHLGFAIGRPTGDATMVGWARFPDRRPLDVLSLLLFADAFPPAVFNGDMPLSWVPTIQLSVQIRRRPVDGWLSCRFSSRFLTGDYIEEDGELWDDSGQLVAVSRQLALAPRRARGGRSPGRSSSTTPA